MSPAWRSFWFFVLAIAFVIWIDRISIHARTPHSQASTAQATEKPEMNSPTSSRLAPNARAQLVPLYPKGDLFVRKIKKPKAKSKPKKLKKATVVKKRKKPNPSPLPTPNRDGNRPILEVGYDEIGFVHYLDVMERIGRFFILLKTKKGPNLGPEVSFGNGVLSTQKSDLSMLAADRPHLVSDPKIQERLAEIKLPFGAHDDSVVLMLNKPFDALLWDTISETLSKRGFSLDQVRLVSGAYVIGKDGIFLNLKNAITKNGKRRIPLKRRLRVSLL
jgi:hypothetical protein